MPISTTDSTSPNLVGNAQPSNRPLPLGVDVVIRVHDPGRALELDRALFSLASQTFQPVHPIIAIQGCGGAASARVRNTADVFDWQERGHHPPTVIAVSAPAGRDIRARLLNEGIRYAKYRFLAFLDFDDYLYEDAYEYLAGEALREDTAITFGGIVRQNVRVFEKFIYAASQSADYVGEGIADFMVTNICPIHSFVIDRAKVLPGDLIFNIALKRLEDYDLLLRLCDKYTSRFASRAKPVGVYNWHLDGRGTTQFFDADPEKAAADRQSWNQARRHIWRVKSALRSRRKRLPSLEAEGQSDGVIGDHELVVKHPKSLPPPLFPPGHFYSPIANPIELRARESRLWSQSDDMCGVNLNAGAQLMLLDLLRPHTASINYPIDDPGDNKQYFYRNDQFPLLDAEFLHAALCFYRPKMMIEVGSGFSSLITAEVNRCLLGQSVEFICIEPYPRQFLIDGVEGITRLVRQRVEDLDLSFFDRLESGDVLFIDSSHVAKVGSDVNHLFFNVVPRLQPGVVVHFHDIFLPDEYPKRWVLDEGRNWNEQYFLRAFLEFNPCFEVVWAAHFMGTRHTEAVLRTFPRYLDLGGAGSFWIRRRE